MNTFRNPAPAPSIPLPPAPWRDVALRFVGGSALADCTRVEYGAVTPLWPVEGWSHGEQVLWHALRCVVSLVPPLTEARGRLDDRNLAALAGLIEGIGAASQPTAIAGEGVA